MSTSEQRVRARKTRQNVMVAAEQPVKSDRSRRAKDIPRSWVCEGQMDLFAVPESGDPDA
ncbi:hypothetical protein ABZ319_34645 [Nocardia sp. NPDC005978]|uniref:hypothetical protein n=1 Tax=Nocardia sp. NPDC005978 TaxID=3156725 RepID=UPI0033B3FCF5